MDKRQRRRQPPRQTCSFTLASTFCVGALVGVGTTLFVVLAVLTRGEADHDAVHSPFSIIHRRLRADAIEAAPARPILPAAALYADPATVTLPQATAVTATTAPPWGFMLGGAQEPVGSLAATVPPAAATPPVRSVATMAAAPALPSGKGVGSMPLIRVVDDVPSVTTPLWVSQTAQPPTPPRRAYETASVVLACRNENRYLQKTVAAILDNTPRPLLAEIVIVDDASDVPMSVALRGDVHASDSKLKFVRRNESLGLMVARLTGARAASGDVLVFLDCHVKVTENWLPPILKHVNYNYRRVVTPDIPSMDVDFNILPGTDSLGQFFDWGLDSFFWLNYPSDTILIMAGGLFAISKDWWYESGEYDTGMRGWGSEQWEQSVRIWCCGGELIIDRDVKIGHRYRGPKTEAVPYKNPTGSALLNKVRAVEVWMGEFRDKFYKVHPEGKALLTSDFDISDMLGLKERLGCKPFSWYVEKFRAVFVAYGMIVDDRAKSDCQWERYAGKFLGDIAWVDPEYQPLEYQVAELGAEGALQAAQERCELLGVVCAGVTCSEKNCSPRKGRAFLKDSPNEVSYLKLCCRYTQHNGYYLRRLAYLGPIIPETQTQQNVGDLKLALNRCEALTDLCIGVSCDASMCMAREGIGGLVPSPNGEVTYLKDCG